jgi:hypothetical protein
MDSTAMYSPQFQTRQLSTPTNVQPLHASSFQVPFKLSDERLVRKTRLNLEWINKIPLSYDEPKDQLIMIDMIQFAEAIRSVFVFSHG